MKYDLWGPPDYNWIFDELEQRPEEEQERFFQLVLDRILKETSPVEVALRFIKTEEQLRELLERIRLENDEASVESNR